MYNSIADFSIIVGKIIDKFPKISVSLSNTAQDNTMNWILVVATILGPMIGAIVTLWTVKRTIKFEVEMREKDKIPIIYYTALTDKTVQCENEVGIVLENGRSYPRNIYGIYSWKHYTLDILLTNQGLGVALDIKVSDISTNFVTFNNASDAVNLQVGEIAHYSFNIKLVDDVRQQGGNPYIRITFFYKNVYSRQFKQVLTAFPDCEIVDEKYIFFGPAVMSNDNPVVISNTREPRFQKVFNAIFDLFLPIISFIRTKYREHKFSRD